MLLGYARVSKGEDQDPRAQVTALRAATEDDDEFDPVAIPGKPLSEIILEDRR
jgi:hypothetical protein